MRGGCAFTRRIPMRKLAALLAAGALLFAPSAVAGPVLFKHFHAGKRDSAHHASGLRH
jgi:hypothetical protein